MKQILFSEICKERPNQAALGIYNASLGRGIDIDPYVGSETSTFKLDKSDDSYRTKVYRDENGYVIAVDRFSSENRLTLSNKDNVIIAPCITIKTNVREALKQVSEFVKKYNFNALTPEKVSANPAKYEKLRNAVKDLGTKI